MTVVEVRDAGQNGKQDDKPKKEKGANKVLFDSFDAGQEFARKLIPKHHHDLAAANILFLCRSKSIKRNGTPVPGTVRLANPCEKVLTRESGLFSANDNDTAAHFVVFIALDVWNGLEVKQRTALIDHLLTRMLAEEDEQTGEMNYRIRPPDVQEFADIAERHGAWNTSLAEMRHSLADK